jgi:hypothetical protein
MEAAVSSETLVSIPIVSLYVTDLFNALSGNGSLNTVQHATIDEAVFSISSAPLPVLETDQ